MFVGIIGIIGVCILLGCIADTLSDINEKQVRIADAQEGTSKALGRIADALEGIHDKRMFEEDEP